MAKPVHLHAVYCMDRSVVSVIFCTEITCSCRRMLLAQGIGNMGVHQAVCMPSAHAMGLLQGCGVCKHARAVHDAADQPDSSGIPQPGISQPFGAAGR